MPAPTRQEVLDWVEAQAGRALSPADQADVLGALALQGDAAAGLIQRFASRFDVDMAGYRAEMHHHPQAALGRPGWPLPLTPPCGLFLPIPLTTLITAAQTRRWPLAYPQIDFRPPSLAWANLPLILLGLPLLTLLALVLLPRIF